MHKKPGLNNSSRLPTCVLTPDPQFPTLNHTQVNHLLLEFLNKYVAEVVSDATSFQEHASKPELDTDDIRWAFRTHDGSKRGSIPMWGMLCAPTAMATPHIWQRTQQCLCS